MKPAPFRYCRPETVEEALALLGEHAEDAALLAGGQSLVPTMNFRLAQPAVLIDLNRVRALFFIEPREDGGVRLGAMTRQASVERSELVREQAPLLFQTMPYIAHPQIRNRGTVGGSLAHADPSAELPTVASALHARFRLRSASRDRWVEASDFYTGMFATAREPDELLAEIELPPMAASTGWDFQEVARRHGDYALVGVAAVVTLDDQQRCSESRLRYLSIGDGVVGAPQAEASLQDGPVNEESILEAARIAAGDDVEPWEDMHASVAYKRRLVEVLTARALRNAVGRI